MTKISYQEKYGIATALSHTWLPLPPGDQLIAERGDKILGDMYWIREMSANTQFCTDGKGHLHNKRCLKISGLASDTLPISNQLVQSDNHKSNICILRWGGLGDLLMMTAIIRQLDSTTDIGEIALACSYQYAPAMREILPAHIRVISVPCLVSDLMDYDQIVVWDGIERDRERFEHHRGAQVYAEAIGIHSLFNPRPWLTDLLEHARRQEHKEKLDAICNGKKLVIMQLGGSVISKSPDHNLILESAKMLADKGYYVIVTAFESELEIRGLKPDDMPEGVDIATDKYLGGTFEWLCLLSCADVIVAPDSAALHVAYGCDIPAVGLFCPTSRFMWFPEAMNLVGIHGKCTQHPCMGNDFRTISFPCNNPGQKGYAVGWNAVSPAEITAAVEVQL